MVNLTEITVNLKKNDWNSKDAHPPDLLPNSNPNDPTLLPAFPAHTISTQRTGYTYACQRCAWRKC